MHARPLVAGGDELRDEAGIVEHAGCDDELSALVGTVLAARPVVPRALLHMDYHPFNVLDDGERVSGVVDATNVSVGDSRFDIARTRSLFVQAEVLNPDYVATVEPLLQAWRAGYEQVAPIPAEHELAPFLACAGQLLVADWEPRVRAGEVSAAVLEVAGDWAAQWRTRALADAPA